MGADDVRGLYVARSLSRHRVPLIGIFRERWAPGRWSRYWDRTVLADTDDPEEVLEVLERLGSSFDQKAVLIPCFDTTVIALARNRGRLDLWYHILQPRPETVEMMMNKVSFYRYALERGFPLPTTSFLDDEGDLELSDRHQFPVVVKPPGSKHPAWQTRTHLKALRADTPEELAAVYREYRTAVNGPLIVQDWVEGGDDALYACHVVYSSKGRPLATFTSKKLRQWPPYTGEVSLAVEVESPDVRETAIQVFDSVQYQGMGYIEMKRDTRTGALLLIEPNLRASGRAGLAEAAGVELVYTMYCDAIGAELPENRIQRYTGKKWMFLRKDLQSAVYYWRDGQLTLTGWWKSVSGVSTMGILSLKDPCPFVGDILRALRLKLSRKERSKRDFRNPIED